jgi:hypothetical protein
MIVFLENKFLFMLKIDKLENTTTETGPKVSVLSIFDLNKELDLSSPQDNSDHVFPSLTQYLIKKTISLNLQAGNVCRRTLPSSSRILNSLTEELPLPGDPLIHLPNGDASSPLLRARSIACPLPLYITQNK